MQIRHSYAGTTQVMPHARVQRSTTPRFQSTLGLSQGTSPRSANDKTLRIGMAGSESHSLIMATLNRPTSVIVVRG